MGTRRYTGLRQALAALPADQTSVRLTFTEIETLVGPLPASANTTAYWWNSQVARLNWIREGFTARLDRLERTVTFTRRG